MVGLTGLLSKRLTVDWLSPESAARRLMESDRRIRSFLSNRTTSRQMAARRSDFVTLHCYRDLG